MKITHNIALSVSSKEQAAFKKVGVDLPLGFTSFKLAEDDSRWEKISALAVKFQAVDLASTAFTTAEMNEAQYLKVSPSWHCGYPEPSIDGSYLSATYDLSHYCPACGTGKRQVSPFRMKRSPAWGTKSILQLNWIFDEYFVTPTAWRQVFEAFGIACKPVLLDRTGEVLDSVVQLDIPKTHELNFDGDFELCKACNIKKYLPITRGFCPLPKDMSAHDCAFKSTQYVGSGASANRLVMMSAELFRAIKAARLTGAEFIPCK